MSTHDRQHRMLSLFKHIEFLNTGKSPVRMRDPRLANVGRLPRGAHFSAFNKKHSTEAFELFRIFHAAKDFEDFLHLAEQAKHFVNEGLFTFSAFAATYHRDDEQDEIPLPPIQEAFPDYCIPIETITQAIKADFNRINDAPIIIDIAQTGNNLDPEYQLAYFREDIEMNAHHWKWHIIFPAYWDSSLEGKLLDRKGELFNYMHQQMSARYDCERLSAGLRRAIPLHNFNEKLDGHSPHLTLCSGKRFCSRPSGLSLRDLNIHSDEMDIHVEVLEITRWRERILNAIDLGVVIDNHGNEIQFDTETGIDVLGAMVEANYENKNQEFYGNLHNQMHNMISLVHDPDGRYKEYSGVMGNPATALRDPIFFRLHRFVDDIFQKYKATLPVYEKKDLDFPGVSIVNVSVKGKLPNILNTFMTEDLLELSYAIPLTGEVKVKFQHLDHEPYTYHISCENNTGGPKEATVRIFLAPVHDELGNKFPLKEARRYFIELDKFRTELAPGKNTITRMSKDSSVTLERYPKVSELLDSRWTPEDYRNVCLCGWPDHLLLPKGNHKGMDFYLFVMLTNYEQDKVEGQSHKAKCDSAVSFCGLKDQKFPDKKAMGFPFDRVIKALTIPEFSSPNMIFQKVKIQFKE